MNIGHDRIDILGFFFRRVGVVHADVADAAELVRDAEIQTDRFRMADVQVTIRLRRETRPNFSVLPRANILRDNVANKIGRSWIFSRRCHW